MFLPLFLYVKEMVGGGNESSGQAVLNDLESCTIFSEVLLHILYKSSLQLMRTQSHSHWGGLLGFGWLSVSPISPFSLFTLFLSLKRELDNNANSISFSPYLEVFVGILRFLQIHHHGFWKVEGWILTKICLSSPLYFKISCFLLQKVMSLSFLGGSINFSLVAFYIF